MKRILACCVFAVTLLAVYAPASTAPTKVGNALYGSEDSVYVCDSKSSYAYHSSLNCRGLKRCNHKTIKVSKKEAVEKYARKGCQLCE